jgi:hypothetical protein
MGDGRYTGAGTPGPAEIVVFIERFWWGRAGREVGDLLMCLQLMWLQFEVVRGPVGVVWG